MERSWTAPFRIRMATEADAPELLAIYEPFVAGTTVSFETESPGLAVFTRRMGDVMVRYPYLICDDARAAILGYAYAHAFKERAAYRWSAELSVYTRPECAGRRVGRTLYRVLMELLERQNFHTVYGVVTDPNPASQRMHEDLGFTRAGLMRKTGYKLGQWLDVSLYEKRIRKPESEPADPIPITELPTGVVDAVLRESAALLR
ncbi:MAG: GNAT family N-acetyltransferase [Deltaproteobacteria bacterium]|jgi:phosphinothricin acetyltransferase|nr:GNAT family N-acetyltransferase [Deltaproteobacteria bacterium]